MAAPDVRKKERQMEIIPVVDSYEGFKQAIDEARAHGIDSIEVSEKVMKVISGQPKTKSITYGTPGIRVYLSGVRDQIDKEESMSAETYYNYLGNKTREA